MKTTYRFYKSGEEWFIDLPEYDGSHADLQMVAGADTMLDYFDVDNSGKVVMKLSLDEKMNYALDFVYELETGGAYYQTDIDNTPLVIWLCPVVVWLYGEYPKVLNFSIC